MKPSLRHIWILLLAGLMVLPGGAVAEELVCETPASCCCVPAGVERAVAQGNCSSCCTTTVTVQTRQPVSHVAGETVKQRRPVVVPHQTLEDLHTPRLTQSFLRSTQLALSGVPGRSLLALHCMLTT